MTNKLYQSLYEQKKQTTPTDTILNGVLGVNIGGQVLVEVPSRSSFVYVRLRQNPNEVIQAFNNKISQVYDLPVQVHYKGFRYEVIGLDTTRYGNNWADGSTSYLPKHGIQHTFPDNLTIGGGGDVSFIYPRQYMPMLGMPSGSLGGPNILVNSYIRKLENGNWFYDNLTGTQNLVPTYNPPGANAVMGLVYKDYDSGNPYFIINSGSYFSNSITGTSQIIQYLPALPNPRSIPIMAVRLVSGTSSIGWDNLVDVRQWYYTVPTGSGGGGIPDAPADGKTYGRNNNIWVNATGTGGGGGIPAGSGTYIQYNDGGVFGGDGRLTWDKNNRNLIVGDAPPILNTDDISLVASSGTAPAYIAWEFDDLISPFAAPGIQTLHAGGTRLGPTNTKNNMGLFRAAGKGYDGSSWGGTVTNAQMLFAADGNWSITNHPTRIEFYTTPSGTTAEVLAATYKSDGSLNMTAHQIHSLANATVAGDAVAFGQVRERLSANRTYYVSTTGNDANDGLTSGTPFATIQKAFTMCSSLDISTYNLDIQLADGTYTAAFTMYGPLGTGIFTIRGNSTTPANVLISTTNADAFNVYNGIKITIRDMKIQTTTSGQCINARIGSNVILINLVFGACAGDHISSGGGYIGIGSNYAITGGASHHFIMTLPATIEIANITVTLTGTPAFSVFALAQMGTISCYAGIFSGAATGLRYLVLLNGVINTFGGGANLFPGNAAGATGSGGQYA